MKLIIQYNIEIIIFEIFYLKMCISYASSRENIITFILYS